jgi:SSS family transporter
MTSPAFWIRPVRRLPAALLALGWLLLAMMPATYGGEEPERLKLSVKPSDMSFPPGDFTGGFLSEWDGSLLAGNAEGSLLLRGPAGSEWVATGERFPLWAAQTSAAGKQYLAGGLVENRPVNTVEELAIEGGKIVRKQLPPLPAAVAGAAAAVVEGRLYVVGGVRALDPPAFETRAWSLDITNPAAGWTELPALPSVPRAFASACSQYGTLVLVGGLVPSPEGTGVVPTSETWAFRPKPVEGTKSQGWKRMADAPRALAAARSLPVGQLQVMVVGGDSKAAVPPEPAAGSDTAVRAICFHTVTDAWSEFDSPVAGGLIQATKWGNRFLVAASGGGLLELELVRSVRSLGWIDYLVVAGYFVIIISIGFYFSRQESSEEFSLGNRKVKWWAAGISMFATGASAISFMAVPALAFTTNLVWLVPVLILIPSYWITAYLIFPMLRRMNITSTYEYLERRFNRPLRYIASAQCIILQTFGRGSVVLLLPALAISLLTGLDVILSVILMGAVTTVYTARGGFEAVIWTEVFQGILKFFAPLAMIAGCLLALPGGVGEFFQTGMQYSKFDMAVLSWDVTVPALWIIIFSGLLVATVVPAGDQPIIQRVFSSPVHEVRRVNLMSTICGVSIGLITQIFGIAMFCYFRAHPAKFDATVQADQVVALFVTQAMPPGFAGVIVAAIFASAMATVASGMNSVATIFTEDFYMRFRPQSPDRQRLRVMRIASILVGALATLTAIMLAVWNLKSMMVVWNQIVALMGGGIVGVYSLGMFTRRANGFGAVCGAIFSVILTTGVKFFTPVHWAAYLPIAIVSCIGFGYLFSFLRPAPSRLDGLTIFDTKPEKQTA